MSSGGSPEQLSFISVTSTLDVDPSRRLIFRFDWPSSSSWFTFFPILGKNVNHELEDGQSNLKINRLEGSTSSVDVTEMKLSCSGDPPELIYCLRKLLKYLGHQIGRDNNRNP